MAVRGRAFLNEYISSGRPIPWHAFNATPYHDEAALILACIEKGIVFRRPLIETAAKAGGYTGRMVGRVLNDFEGNDPRCHLWHKVKLAPDLDVYKAHHLH